MLDLRFVVMIEKRRKASVDPAIAGRQSSFGRRGGQRVSESNNILVTFSKIELR